MKHDKCFGLHLGGGTVLSTFSSFFFNQYLIITVLGLGFLDIFYSHGNAWTFKYIGKNYLNIFSNMNAYCCWQCLGCHKLYFQNCGIKTFQPKCLNSSVLYMPTVLDKWHREEWDMMNLWVSWPTPCIQETVNIYVIWLYNQEVQYPSFLSGCKEMKYMGK